MPIELELSLTNNIDVSVERQKTVKIQKYMQDTEKVQVYYDMFFTEEISSLFTHATELIGVDVEAAIKIFDNGVKLAGNCMKRIITTGNISEKPQFDYECAQKRCGVRKALRKYNVSKNDLNHNELRISYTEKERIQTTFEAEKV